MSIYEKQAQQLLKNAKIDFVTEHRFAPPRRWRFDFCLKPLKCKIAIEIEGGCWQKSRHGHGQGFINDCEKYNRAMIDGWIIFRYPPELIPNILTDLKKLTEK